MQATNERKVTEEILSKGRQKGRVQARDFLCFLAATTLSIPITDLARRMGLAPSTISYAVMGGKKSRKSGDCPE